MPTYEYRCASCGNEFERFQKISDAALGECPNCGGEVERLISRGGGVLFKGSGFYATDYRAGGREEKKKPKESGKAPEGTADE